MHCQLGMFRTYKLIVGDVNTKDVISIIFHNKLLFVTFSLERKSNQKVQGQPDPLRAFVRLTPPLTLKWISVV